MSDTTAENGTAEAASAPPSEELKNLSVQENGGGAEANHEGSGDTAPAAGSSASFADTFKAFCKYGDTKSDGKLITLSQSDKWMKQAKVIDGKKITTTDTGIHFKKLKSLKVGIVDYKKFLDELAKSKKIEVEDLKTKMAGCGQPSHGGAGVKTTSTVNRLTDTSKYTGTHKQRFDESGKGKGIAGRKDVHDNAGYVSGYQKKDSFGKPEGT